MDGKRQISKYTSLFYRKYDENQKIFINKVLFCTNVQNYFVKYQCYEI